MINRTPQEKPLLGWESWPLWALGLSNGLNIVLWYVLSMARVNSPELPIGILGALTDWLPLIVVAGGIAQALSLDGALIATIAGARHGRRGIWTWLTIVGAGLFSAAISYAVHSGRIDQLPILHVASAVNLVFYNMHLAQPRKALHPVDQRLTTVTNRTNGYTAIDDLGHIDGFKCDCGALFPTPNAVKAHKKNNCPQTFKIESLPDAIYGADAARQNGKHDV
jgi:hypothetical protein